MMPAELAPLALWGFPLLTIGGAGLVCRVVITKLNEHGNKIDELMRLRVHCVKEFASKREHEELDAQVQGISRILGVIEGKVLK